MLARVLSRPFKWECAANVHNGGRTYRRV